MDDRIRVDAKRLLEASYQRQVISQAGRRPSVEPSTVAEPVLGLSPAAPYYDTLIEYMENEGWIEPDPMFRNAVGNTIYLIAEPGLKAIREDA